MDTQELLDKSISNVERAAARSNGLWLYVNRNIANALRTGRDGKQSLEHIALFLEHCAGQKRDGEPICMENYRSAARQLREGTIVSVL